MGTDARLDTVFANAPVIEFDDKKRFILFSDTHRGDGSWADDFASNQQLYYFALAHYNTEKYTYIEVGDGDELWENRSFTPIRRAQDYVFDLLREFYDEDRFLMLYGNHDIERQNPRVVRDTLYHYYDEQDQITKPLFEGITVHEGLVLLHTVSGQRVFVVHGHQADPISDRWWRFSRFMVRNFWRNMQLLGLRDPTSPAKNHRKRNEVEQRLIRWITARKQLMIAGHTHRSTFPIPGAPPYFNIGSCVHPRGITGIEIVEGAITLVKWSIKPNADGQLTVMRDVMAGPRALAEYAQAAG